jgi:AAA domain
MNKDPNATAIADGPQAVRIEFDKASTNLTPEFIFAGDVDVEPPRMLVKGLFPFDGIAFVGGQSGAAKTFVVVYLAHSLATALPFFGRIVKERVGVVIVASEGQNMMAARIEAVRRIRSPEILRPPIAWITNLPPFKMERDIKNFATRLRAVDRRFQSEFSVRLGAVIIDTVAATFDLEDEDDNSEAARTIRKMRQLGRAVGALIIPVHHYGKAATTGLRGGSGWRAGADVVISVLADRDGITGEVKKTRELAVAKARDGIEGPVAPFTLPFITLGVDEDGEAFGSCIIEPILGRAAQHAARAAHVPKESRALRTFRDAFAEVTNRMATTIEVVGTGQTARAVRVQDVRAEFTRRYATGEGTPRQQADSARQAFKRVLEKLPSQFATQTWDDEEWVWAAT